VKNLEAEYAGTVWFDRYILGTWALAEGLIFPNHKKALVETVPQNPQEYALSIDYGTSNPFAVLLWARCGNVWYAVREIYYSGRDTGVQKTDDQYLKMLEDLIEPIKPSLIESGRDMWGNVTEIVNRIPVVIDPSAASFIALLRQSKWFAVREADNSVIDGIRNTSTAIERGLIKVSTQCKCWLNEAQSYIWDEKALEDRPIKENDHLMDSMRYFVQTMRLVRSYEPYKSPFTGGIIR
jgi:PBSX family phage terminase large subunit